MAPAQVPYTSQLTSRCVEFRVAQNWTQPKPVQAELSVHIERADHNTERGSCIALKILTSCIWLRPVCADIYQWFGRISSLNLLGIRLSSSSSLAKQPFFFFLATAFHRNFCQIVSGFNYLDFTRSSALRPTANLGKQVPVFISPRNSVAQLYPHAPSSLSVAFWDSRGYGGGILSLLHAVMVQGQLSRTGGPRCGEMRKRTGAKSEPMGVV
jgi:hypothetical protein